MTHEETIRQAFHALAGYRSPALTKKQQTAELARCWELLAGVVYGTDESADTETETTGGEA
tara:strand:- start:2992 stop:3174 length:183 start_codon:yes stop_codon:yes gene_type:complete